MILLTKYAENLSLCKELKFIKRRFKKVNGKISSGAVKQKVLIVDDSEMNREMLADILEDEYEIMQAKNGVEAVSILKEDHLKIALVMLDMVMPEMDGMGVLEVMNKNRWIDSIPVIMISVENSSDHIEKAYDLGVTDYIKRPFDAVAVRRRVINTMMLYANQKKLLALVSEQIYEKEKSTNMMINILSHIVEFRNGESGLHVLHIKTITQALLNRYVELHKDCGISKTDIANITLASALHDIGKISIPEEILNKPGRLTDEEFTIMKTHSAIGASMLENLPFEKDEPLLKMAYQVCRWHHERYDGRGYPDGLKGDEIPLSAQVVAVADVYDALTSERVYKKAFSHEKAMEMILGGECGTFNPDVLECLKDTAETLIEELKANATSHISRHEVQSITEEMLSHNDVTVTDQTLNTLESERVKHQFLTSISREIQFDYISEPPMLTFSEWSAKKLELQENIIDPKSNESLLSIISEESLNELSERVRKTTPDQPVVEYECDLKIDGIIKRYKIVCRSMWTEKDSSHYIGAVGKVLDADDTHLQNIDFRYMTTHDPLTGLLNIYSAQRCINDMLDKNPDTKYAAAVIALEYFKFSGSERLNHSFRDGILKFTSKRLAASIDANDIAARIDGNSFLVFISYENNVTEKLDHIINEITFRYDDFSVCAYMGAASTDETARNYESLYACASKALKLLNGNETGKYLVYRSDGRNVIECSGM